MGTRATIAIRKADNTFQSVYLHFDGYPQHTGVALREWFASEQQARDLIGGGDIRCVDPATGAVEYFSDGEPPTRSNTHDNLMDVASASWACFLYLFEDGRWSCTHLASASR